MLFRSLSGGSGGASKSPAASKKEVFGGAEASCAGGVPDTLFLPELFVLSDCWVDSSAREVVESSKFMV